MLGFRLTRHTSQCMRSLATFSKDRKRFYRDIDVVKSNEGYQISLDGKYHVRTPLKNLLVLPTEKLANAVAVEWDTQKKNITFAVMPLTSLCFKATDQPIPSSDLIEDMLEFLRTDTVCYRAPPEEDQLHSMEKERWDPLTEWFSEHFHVHLSLTTDITLTPQPEQTICRVRDHLVGQHPWTIPAYHQSTASMKSMVIALALLDGGLSAEEAIACASLESDFQIDRWGEVEWQHTLDRARLCADTAAAVLLVNEVKSLSEEKAGAIS